MSSESIYLFASFGFKFQHPEENINYISAPISSVCVITHWPKVQRRPEFDTDAAAKSTTEGKLVAVRKYSSCSSRGRTV